MPKDGHTSEADAIQAFFESLTDPGQALPEGIFRLPPDQAVNPDRAPGRPQVGIS